MDRNPIILDIGAKEYIENEKCLYEKLKKNNASEDDILSHFMLEFVLVFIDTYEKGRWLVKRAIQENNGYEQYGNAMFIYNVVTEVFQVEYKKLFEEY